VRVYSQKSGSYRVNEISLLCVTVMFVKLITSAKQCTTIIHPQYTCSSVGTIHEKWLKSNIGSHFIIRRQIRRMGQLCGWDSYADGTAMRMG
jgi:hypothetical protein